MTTKVHGAVYPGIWVEKQVSFVKLTFAADIGAAAANSTFGVVESCLAQALKIVEQKSTILGVSNYDAASKSVDVMVGPASGWFADANGVIATGISVTGAAVDASGAAVAPVTTTVDVHFSAFSGTLPVATAAAGDLAVGPGATSGATPTASPTGTPGYYPVLLITA